MKLSGKKEITQENEFKKYNGGKISTNKYQHKQ